VRPARRHERRQHGQRRTELISYLEKHRGGGATWLLAVSDSANALTASMTLDKLKELVKSGELHYVQLGGRTGGGSNSLSSEVTATRSRPGRSRRWSSAVR
jgi:hypothetical protein